MYAKVRGNVGNDGRFLAHGHWIALAHLYSFEGYRASPRDQRSKYPDSRTLSDPIGCAHGDLGNR